MVIRPVNAVVGWLFRGFNRLFDAASHGYSWMVGKLMRISLIVLLAYGGLVALSYHVFQQAPTGFIPQQDQGRLIVNVQLPDSASLQRTKEAMALVDKITRNTPGVAHAVGLAGMSFLLQSNASNFGSMFVVLDPFDKRKAPGLNAAAIMARLLPEYRKQIKDAVVSVRNSSPIPGLGVAGGFKVMVEDRGGRGLTDLQIETDRLTSRLRSQRGLADVATGFRSNAPSIFLDIDRTKAVALGVAFEDVNQTLSMLLGSLYVNSFNQFGRHWQVTVQAEGEYRNRIEALNLFQVRNLSRTNGAAGNARQREPSEE